MEVVAKLNFFRKSPKRVRVVADLVRGAEVNKALNVLNFTKKEASKVLIKLINSAVANAEHNFNLDKNNLLIKKIEVNEGSMLKRWTPKAHGRATPVRKRSAHITLVLGEIVESKDIKKREQKIAEPIKLSEALKEKEPETISTVKEEKISDNEKTEKKKETTDLRMKGKDRHIQHRDQKDKKGQGGFLKKIFNRKTD